ncbi:MAG: hypothetical protein NT039_00260 [Candidatus Berkelbacteria bacterium]|nr:hypothetical protein [Candidatus Berkelbacteria bacterium]
MPKKQPTKPAQPAQTPPPAQPAPAPQKQGMSTGAKVAIGFGIGCLVIIIVAIILVATGCSKFVKEVNKNVSGSLSPTPTPTIQYTFDATSLLGKSVTDIRSTLGQPTTTKASSAPGKNYSDEYVKGDASLRYDYNSKSEAINKFYLVMTKNGTLTNYVTTFNLKEGDPHYEILFAEAVRAEDKAKLAEEGSDYIYASVELK